MAFEKTMPFGKPKPFGQVVSNHKKLGPKHKKHPGRGEKNYKPKETGIDTSPSSNFRKKVGM